MGRTRIHLVGESYESQLILGWVKNSSGFDIPTCRTIIHAILEQIHRPPYFHDMWF